MIKHHARSIRDILSLDDRSLALFRVLLGAIVVLDSINRIHFVPMFYSDNGFLPRNIIQLAPFENMFHFQIFFLSGSEWFAYLLFSCLLIFGLLLLVGFKTRLMIFLCWLLMSSAIIRDPYTSHAADNLLIILLFWSFFLPIGYRFSIDSFRINKSNNHQIFSVATFALYVQISLMYVMTGLFKAKNESWLDGTFIYLTLSRFDYVEPFAFFLYPYYELLRFLTQFTLILELFGPFLLFIPLFFLIFRYTVITLFIGLQISIGLMMDVGLFPVVSITCILVFLPSHFWNVLKKLATKFSKFYSQIFIKNYLDKSIAMENKKWVRIFIIFMICYILLWNISQVTNIFYRFQLPTSIAYIFKVDQRWNMFTYQAQTAEYLSLEVILESGETLDLISELKIVHNAPNDFTYTGYNNYRWRIFFSNVLRHEGLEDVKSSLIEYYLKEENIKIELVDEVELVGYFHSIGEFYNHSDKKRRILYSYKSNLRQQY